MQKDFLLYCKSWQKLKDEKNCEVEEAEKKHYKNVRNPYRKDEERCVEKLLSDARFSFSLAKKTGLAQWSSLKSKPKMANTFSLIHCNLPKTHLNGRNLVTNSKRYFFYHKGAPKTSFVTFAFVKKTGLVQWSSLKSKPKLANTFGLIHCITRLKHI